MPWRSIPLVVALVATIALVAVACGSSSSPAIRAATTLEAAAQRGPFAAGVTTLELVDDSRSTEANRDFPGALGREYQVEVWYPALGDATEPEVRGAELATSDAPYPLVVFSHGLSGTRRQSVSYTQHLASHGYVVVAADYPLSNAGAPGGPSLTAVLNQAEDVSFIIDTFLDFAADPTDLLFGAIDPAAIGVTGHSLGAMTSMLAVFGEHRDERVDAALPISTPGCFLPNDLAGGDALPLLAIGGTRDLITPPVSARRSFDVANPPRYYVELTGASHVRFADFDIDDAAVIGALSEVIDDGSGTASEALALAAALGGDVVSCLESDANEDDPALTLARQGELLRIFATPFFDAYLRGSDEARAFLDDELTELVPEARVEIDLG